MEEGDQDTVISIFKLDPSSLIVEGPEKILGATLDPDAVQKGDESFIVVPAGRMSLAFFLYRGDEQSRLVITVGTGDQDGIIARARNHAASSAHQRMDHTLAEHDSKGEQPLQAREPLSWIISRMRPATSTIPCPWITNDEDEPAWRLASLYPAFLTMLDEFPDIAAGLLTNLIDGVDEDGKVPLAGGNASPIFYGHTDTPIIIQMVMDFMRRRGYWPMEQNLLGKRLSIYMTGTGRWISGNSADVTRETTLHWLREHHAWQKFLDHTGYTSGAHENARIPKAVSPGLPAVDSADSQLLDLLDPSVSQGQKSAAAEIVDRIVAGLAQGTHGRNLPLLFFALHHAPDWKDAKLPEQLNSLHASLLSLWQEKFGSLDRTKDPDEEPDLLFLAGLCEWSNPQLQKEKIRQNRIVGIFYRHRRLLIGTAAVAILLFLAFFLRVQTRSTMPTTVFETQIGLARQDYEFKRYDQAIDRLLEIEARDNQRNPVNLFLLGKVYYQVGRYDDAVKVNMRVTEIIPDTPPAWFNLGLSQFRAGDAAQAMETFAFTAEQFGRTHPSIAARAMRARQIVESNSSGNKHLEGE